MKSFFQNNLLLIGILLVYLFVVLYQLDTIPGEIWGDAISHYYLAEKILQGHFFIDYEFGGDGPIFSYLAAFTTNFLPLSFYSLKFTAVWIGFFFVLSMYFLTEEFFHNKTISLMSTFISGVSFWTIVFARQPHARILVPLFISLTLIYTLKKKNKFTGLLLGLGMYTQASFWGMIFTYWKNWRILLIGLVVTIPLAWTFINNSNYFLSGNNYFGEKLAVHTALSQIIYALLYNIQANLLSFNYRGDGIFRMNIPYHPHLDFVSGIFFVAGFFIILYQGIKKKQKNFLLYFILPFFFIQIPSILDIHNYYVQPNISRMIGVIPFVYMSIAYCIFLLAEFLASKVQDKRGKKIVSIIVSCGLLIVIFILNFYNYFIVYPRTLPNGNTPFGKIIAQTIDMSAPDTQVIVIGAGWGQWAQPEVQGIPMVQKTIHTELFAQTVAQAQTTLCQQPMKGKAVMLIMDPYFVGDLRSANLCLQQTTSYMLTKNGLNIAYIIQGRQ